MDKKIAQSLGTAMKRHEKGAVIAIEIPPAAHLKANAASVSLIMGMGYSGIYLTFHVPFEDILSDLKSQGADMDKIIFVTCDAKKSGESRCVIVPKGCNVNDIIVAVGVALPKLKSAKKFIFVDSLTTLSASRQLAEALKFSEFLKRLIKEREVDMVILAFDSNDAVHMKFIEDTAIHVDEIVRLENTGY
ncbi:MAG: hypothetical protein V1861_07050 [Candidatus Micrarchaeota archaeon]